MGWIVEIESDDCKYYKNNTCTHSNNKLLELYTDSEENDKDNCHHECCPIRRDG